MLDQNMRDLKRWLIDEALPVWETHGIDRELGGFHEKLDRTYCAVPATRRARLVARQIYCFSIGQDLGWSGPARAVVNHGLSFLKERLLGSDGTVFVASSAVGDRVEHRQDPYDYAFVLLALASAARVVDDRNSVLLLSCKVCDKLIKELGLGNGGFAETSNKQGPLLGNPQMHLLEAFLALAETDTANSGRWFELAGSIVQLALDHLILPDSGAIPEAFDLQGRPGETLLIEPGHQFEWAWLLARWSILQKDAPALSAAIRLADVGETFGLDETRTFAINALDGNLHPKDRGMRLWPQAERAKAWHTLATIDGSSQTCAHERKDLALVGLNAFVLDGFRGLWNEQRLPDGCFIDEPIKASSLYHLVGAIHTLTCQNPEVAVF
ncbi:AGE family epimerase/isomerase [Notoacmeibacter marinus]|uniref:AGE family epimerase/isomerase n=1 Tax=Notoacmeibacter marinus TaxID=1876515 RepID=UPI000DF4A55D|nr:AGE family epimerase/isomerase [Notoacmeibacter marinus]